MVRGPELPLWKRHVIMAYHVLDGKGTTQIARELGLGVKTVDNVISRAKARCAAGAGVEELMRAVVVQKRSGRPRGRRGAGGGGGGGPGGEGPGLRDDGEEEREGCAANRGGQQGLVYGDEQVYRILQESQDVRVTESPMDQNDLNDEQVINT